MCGIAGFINGMQENDKQSLMKEMLQTLLHRGKDGTAILVKEKIALGHNRLSILDLSISASQPMTSLCQNYHIIFNGEIYNYKKLRIDLQTRGHKFRTNSDTEVLLNALIEWGHKAVDKLNGIFAFAFLDYKKQQLLLARDRVGAKPLYYSIRSDGFYFASEQKAILQAPKFNKKLNLEALQEYMTFQNIFTNQTLVENIYLLEPAHYLLVDINQYKIIEKTKYWDLVFENINLKNENDYVKEFEDVFENVMCRQMNADVEIGAYLSGGIDSASISTVAREKQGKLKTFTVGFSMENVASNFHTLDESQIAQYISERIDSENFQHQLDSDDLVECVNDLILHVEEPRVGQSYPNYFAAQLASRHVKVVLSGTGGDELFGGYPWRYFLNKEGKPFDQYVEDYFQFWQRLIPQSEMGTLFRPVVKQLNIDRPKDIFKNILHNYEGSPKQQNGFLDLSLYFEFKTFLHGLLVVEDKINMAFGLENRVPFLDNELIEFARKLPSNMKLRNIFSLSSLDENTSANKKNLYLNTHSEGKYLLRKALSKRLPKEITNRPKQGFASPDSHWFANQNKEFLETTILRKDNNIFSLIDFNFVKGMFSEHFQGTKNNRLFIWSILYVTLYLENF